LTQLKYDGIFYNIIARNLLLSLSV